MPKTKLEHTGRKDQQLGGAQYPGIRTVTDGAGAVVWVESNISQAACSYPILPSTPMGEGFAAESSRGKVNLWGESIQYLDAESEHSSASACEGFAIAGGRVTSFTSGQGLVLMKEVMHVIAGKRLPVVFHVGARALASQSMSVHCGHDDVMGVADSGWGILFGRNAQEAADLALIARRAAEWTQTPFLNVQDGFLTTHTFETVRLPEPDFMRNYIGAPEQHLRSVFDPERPMASGVVQNQDAFMKGRVAQRFFYERVRPDLQAAMDDFADRTGRGYGLIRTYRMDDAEFAFVGLGSMMETAEATVDYLRRSGLRVGAVSITSFRPFPAVELIAAMRRCMAVAVFERCDVPLADSNPLSAEVKAAFADAMSGATSVLLERMPEIYSVVAGVGGSDVRPGHFMAAGNHMMRGGARSFVLGVKHPDAVKLNIDPDVRPVKAFSLRGHATGGTGAAATPKLLAAAASELFSLNAQAFSNYGSEKNGLPTSYYLTAAPEHIQVHADINNVEFVAVQDTGAFSGGDLLEGLADAGVVYIQTPLPADRVWQTLPADARASIARRKLRLCVLDAAKLERELAGGVKLPIPASTLAVLGVFLRIVPLEEKAEMAELDMFASLRALLAKQVGQRGDAVVDACLAIVRQAYDGMAEVPCPADQEEAVPNGRTGWHWEAPSDPVDDRLVPGGFCDRVVGGYLRGRETELEADAYTARSIMPSSSARHRTFRDLATELPVLDAAACVGCMDCVSQCPDAAILAKVVEPGVLDEKLARIDSPADQDKLRSLFATTTKYHEQIVAKGETGGLFGLFIDAGKCKGCGECIVACGPRNALKMVPKAELELAGYDKQMAFYSSLPDTPARFINEKDLADILLASRAQLHTGGGNSCVGCGEGTAIRLMLAATGFVYGNEVGVVSAAGCNTSFGSTYPYNPYKVPLTNSLFENAPSDAMGIRMRWNQEGHADRKLWVIGGDTALFEMGFQSLSRLLSSGMDINILVLNTEVSYSNTGGQSSKFSSSAARRRKDLAALTMMHPGVFVAQTTTAHLNHFYRSVMAANEYRGPSVVICYASCLQEHGIPDDHAATQAKLAADTRTFPLVVFDPRKGERFSECLSLQGNPALKEDWLTDPKTGEPLDFITFARTEARFSAHFDTEGNPDDFLKQAQQDRLGNWHRLQELAGLR